MPKFYYKPILGKIQEAYLANAQKEYETSVDVESKVVLVIEADNESEADAARIGFIDIHMWDLYQVED